MCYYYPHHARIIISFLFTKIIIITINCYSITCTVCLFGQGSAQCACNDTACRNRAMENSPNQQMCCRWVDQFNDMNPNSLNDPNGTPLGFLLDQYRGTDSNLPDLCVRVFFPTPLRNIRYIVVSVSHNNYYVAQILTSG